MQENRRWWKGITYGWIRSRVHPRPRPSNLISSSLSSANWNTESCLCDYTNWNPLHSSTSSKWLASLGSFPTPLRSGTWRKNKRRVVDCYKLQHIIWSTCAIGCQQLNKFLLKIRLLGLIDWLIKYFPQLPSWWDWKIVAVRWDSTQLQPTGLITKTAHSPPRLDEPK